MSLPLLNGSSGIRLNLDKSKSVKVSKSGRSQNASKGRNVFLKSLLGCFPVKHGFQVNNLLGGQGGEIIFRSRLSEQKLVTLQQGLCARAKDCWQHTKKALDKKRAQRLTA